MSASKREREDGLGAAVEDDGDDERGQDDVKRPRMVLSVSESESSAFHPPENLAMRVLAQIRAQLLTTSNPHLQGKLLLQYSHSAISPGAATDSAIDFLFSFLQQHQTASSSNVKPDIENGNVSSTSTGVNTGGSTTGGPIVVGAIVRGLRRLLWVKAKVVEPMIHVDDMGKQLQECISVAEDFKLRHDMLCIVVDCLMVTKQYARVEILLDICVRQHDHAMQVKCLRAYLQLHQVGYRFVQADPRKLLDRFATFFLYSAHERVRMLSAHLLVVLADLYPTLDVPSKFFPSGPAQEKGTREKCFYLLCMGANDRSTIVRREIALCLRRLSTVSVDIAEHSVQKMQISEDVVDTEMKSILMMSSGVLLSLLEDTCPEVAAEASRTIVRLCSSSQWSERALDRVITAHMDALPRSVGFNDLVWVLLQSLQSLLKARRSHYQADFSMTSEEVNYFLQGTASLSDQNSLLLILSILLLCDSSSTWMARHIVEYALRLASLAEVEVNGTVDDTFSRALLSTMAALREKIASTLHLDVGLMETLRKEASSCTGGLKREACKTLMGELANKGNREYFGPKSDTIDTASSNSGAKISNQFLLSHSRTKVADVASTRSGNLAKIISPPSEQYSVYLKAIQQLRGSFQTDQVSQCYRIAEIIVLLRKHVQSFPDTSVSPSSSYVSINAMIGNSTASNSRTSEAFAGLYFPAVLAHSFGELVDLANGMYIRLYALSSSCRTELLQLILLGRIGLVLVHLQSSAMSTDAGVAESLRWLADEASKLRILCSHVVGSGRNMWFSNTMLSYVTSINDLKREFIGTVRKSWPRHLLQASSSHRNSRKSVCRASIIEPVENNKEPREVVAQWPFESRVRFQLHNVNDISKIFIKSVLPNGNTEYHHVPADKVHYHGPRTYFVDYSITLTISPFSDPTTFSVAICIQHPVLPGAMKMATSSPRSTHAFTEISEKVSTAIFHRTLSNLRQSTTRSTAT